MMLTISILYTGAMIGQLILANARSMLRNG
jgi:hypothetical protein